MSLPTNRSTNVKENKEKRNREKILAGPGSEFSLANPEDFELDYYDYNVTNAGAAPGSYLGMDPAYLIWIPPIDDAIKYDEIDSDQGSDTDEHIDPDYEEISTDFRSPLSNCTTETPIDEPPRAVPYNKYNESDTNYNDHNVKHFEAANELNEINSISRQISFTSTLSSSCSTSGYKWPINSIQMKDFQSKASAVKVLQCRTNDEQHEDEKDYDTEKETAVVKSSNITEYYELDDIQFADEENDINDYTGNSQYDCRDNKNSLVSTSR